MTEPDPPAAQPAWQQSIYDELKRMAQRALSKESQWHSLQPTLLVNDAFLKLLEQRYVDSKDRTKVLAAGAVIIRRMLVDHARRRKAKKTRWRAKTWRQD